jgi:transposase
MPKGIPFSGDFKQKVVETMRASGLAYREAAREFRLSDHKMIMKWERVYLEEGSEGLFVKRRRASSANGSRKGRKPKLDKQVEEDLIAENQRLRAEIDYLKKLNALVTEREQREKRR